MVLTVLLCVRMAGPVGGSAACVRLRVCMAGPSSGSVGGSGARLRQQARQEAFCSSLSTRSALRAASCIGRCCGVVVGGAAVLAAFRGLADLCGRGPHEAVGVVGTFWWGAVMEA